MIQCTSQIIINDAILDKINKAAVQALKDTADELRTEVQDAQVMPRDTGTLQGESTFVDYSRSGEGKVAIISSTPYARRLYFHPEYNFSTKENPNAKGKWYEDWQAGGEKEEFAPKVFQEFYRKELNL